MLRSRATTPIGPVDIAGVLGVLSALVRVVNSLQFAEDGYLETPDGVRQGLRVQSGTHPYPNASYRLVVKGLTPPRLTPQDHADLKQLAKTHHGTATRRSRIGGPEERPSARADRSWS